MKALVARVVITIAVVGLAAGVIVASGQHVHWPFLVLALVGVLAVGAGYDTLLPGPPAWPEPELPATPARDRALARYVHVLHSAEQGGRDDDRLRDLLRQVAGDRLLLRHGVTWDSPEARALLGDDLAHYLGAPPRRISRRVLRRYVERIESL